MVAFTGHLLAWLGCALFRIFVIVGTSYGIYRFFKDKIDDKKRDKYIEKCQEKHRQEIEEAKKRISKMQRKK